MEIPKINILFLLLLSTISFNISAQSSYFQNKRIILNFHSGFVLKNKVETGHLSNQKPAGIELELNRLTKGESEWHQIYKFPETGVSLQYWIMDPEKPLGNQLGLVFYIQKFIFSGSKSSFSYRIGAGPGYIERRFDLYNNNQNNLISSRLNFVLNGRIIYKYRISEQLSINTGLGIVHFSNGALKMPNQGINIPSVHFGLGYHFPETAQIRRENLSPYKKSWGVIANAAFGSKNDYPVGSGNFLISTLSLYAARQSNRKSTIVTGIDYFYDGSSRIWADSSEVNNRFNFTKASLLFGHELTFGKFALLTHIGYIFFEPVEVNSRVYQRYGLKYYITEKVSASVAMKAHLGRADFVEWGIGYKFIK